MRRAIWCGERSGAVTPGAAGVQATVALQQLCPCVDATAWTLDGWPQLSSHAGDRRRSEDGGMAAEAVAWRPVLHGRERPILQGGLGAREGVTKAQMQERGEGAGMTVSSACWPATGVRVAVRGSTYQPPLSAQSAKGNLYAPPANEGCHYQHSCELSEGLSALAFHFYVNLLSHGSRLPHTHTVHSLQITVCWPSRFHILPDATHTKMKNRSDLIRTSRRQCFSGRGIQLRACRKESGLAERVPLDCV